MVVSDLSHAVEIADTDRRRARQPCRRRSRRRCFDRMHQRRRVLPRRPDTRRRGRLLRRARATACPRARPRASPAASASTPSSSAAAPCITRRHARRRDRRHRRMAEAEGLDAHAESARVRRKRSSPQIRQTCADSKESRSYPPPTRGDESANPLAIRETPSAFVIPHSSFRISPLAASRSRTSPDTLVRPWTVPPTTNADALDELLKHHFGHEQFRPMQRDIIGDAIAGRDVFVVMPTGGGKSLCYQLARTA